VRMVLRQLLRRSELLSLILLVVGSLSCATEASAQASRRTALPLPPSLRNFYQDMCGARDDSQEVEFYDGKLGVSRAYVKSNEPSTVQLQWNSREALTAQLPGYDFGNVAGERWCTGTLVSERYILTAGHCFDVQRGDSGWISPFRLGKDKRPEFVQPKNLAKLIHVNFNYQTDPTTGQVRKADVYAIDELSEWREGPDGLDFAIFTIAPDAKGKYPSVNYKPAKVVISDPREKETIAVIQHPNGDPKKIAVGSHTTIVGTELRYSDVDTFGGSSGSGIRNSNGDVVGVHTHGGCEMGDANGGVRSVSIAKVSKILAQLAK
jgi:V8-like Glu-specific endopeptidase